jgi:Poxvirus A22 protein
MLIFSFDPGVKNTGVCVYSTERGDIIDWVVWKTDGTVRDVMVTLQSHVSYVLDLVGGDELKEVIILIERQPPVNKKSTRVQVMLESFFHMNPCFCSRVILMNSNEKWKVFGVNIPRCYKERKKMSVRMCEQFINNNVKWKEEFKNNTKKDDLADCFLQLYSRYLYC